MTDGKFTYYTIQHRRTGESKVWGDPDSEMVPLPDAEWCFSSFDSFGGSFNPHIGTGNNRQARNKKADVELYEVWCKTGDKGWWTLKHAAAALRRVRADDQSGKYDSFDSQTHRRMRSIRREYRIVKMTVSQKTEVVSCDELVEALCQS